MNCRGQWKPIVTMIAVSFGFATVNVLLKKILEQGVNHLVIVTYRQLTSAVFLTPIAYFWERKSRGKLTLQISSQLFFSALIGVTLTQYFLLQGLEYTSTTFLCAFLNAVPVFTFLLAVAFRLEKVNVKTLAGRYKVLGAVVCIGGTIFLILYKGKPLTDPHVLATNHTTNHANKTHRWAVGSIFLTSGSIVFSSWFLVQARIGKRFPSPYCSTAIMSFFAAIQSGILCMIIERKFSGWALKGKLETVGVIYAGIVASGLCYAGMSWCVKQRGPVFTSAFSPLTQIVVAMFDLSVLHERIYLGSVVGSIVVIVGMYILLWGKGKEIEGCDQMKQAQVAQQDEHSNAVISNEIPITINSRST